MANNEKYKVLEVRFNDQLSNSELELINNINKEFSKKDFYLAVERDKIIIYLNQLDLEKFGSMIAKYNLDPTSVFHKAYEQISSIGSYGIKGGKRLFVGYNKERKVANRKGKEKERKKFFYAKGHNFSKQNNEFPSQYLNKIICADSEEFLTQLPDNCVDLIFTSPPYNFGSYSETPKRVSILLCGLEIFRFTSKIPEQLHIAIARDN